MTMLTRILEGGPVTIFGAAAAGGAVTGAGARLLADHYDADGSTTQTAAKATKVGLGVAGAAVVAGTVAANSKNEMTAVVGALVGIAGLLGAAAGGSALGGGWVAGQVASHIP